MIIFQILLLFLANLLLFYGELSDLFHQFMNNSLMRLSGYLRSQTRDNLIMIKTVEEHLPKYWLLWCIPEAVCVLMCVCVSAGVMRRLD